MKKSDYTTGCLPCEAPLAMAYIPMQRSAVPAYDADEALARGTLFPGLDLPFMGMINEVGERCPRSELMAIDFVVDELELYLDTHSQDAEAFMMYQSFLALSAEAHTRYTALFGPLRQTDQKDKDSYTWLCDPWPWDYAAKKEGR